MGEEWRRRKKVCALSRLVLFSPHIPAVLFLPPSPPPSQLSPLFKQKDDATKVDLLSWLCLPFFSALLASISEMESPPATS